MAVFIFCNSVSSFFSKWDDQHVCAKLFFFLNWGSVRFKLQLNLCSRGKFAMISNPAAINISLSMATFCSYGLFLSWCYSMRLSSHFCYADMLMFRSVNLLNWGSVHRLWSSIYNILPLCSAMLKFWSTNLHQLKLFHQLKHFANLPWFASIFALQLCVHRPLAWQLSIHIACSHGLFWCTTYNSRAKLPCSHGIVKQNKFELIVEICVCFPFWLCRFDDDHIKHCNF